MTSKSFDELMLFDTFWKPVCNKIKNNVVFQERFQTGKHYRKTLHRIRRLFYEFVAATC